MKKKPVYVKAVPYQEIIHLRDTIERLESWQEPLTSLENYFAQSHYPLNKKQVVKQYYACAQLFQAFYTTYGHLLKEADQMIDTLTKTSKITVSTDLR
ncbi:hypothetical protein ACYSNW_02130 [Enterococcus sp. LJL99]